ncbi:glyoxylase-like metal-dependent hydrolase (beta-lactamase superfamily II) [Psychromicrobium silvestre]|uniref:Glyoxylase-like metal-dependent hydrolase (Beta-lactamase superfamily II) n=1 Tax=Psychromicrobium silvestre TaxID=1645614 RepID=A0A7Y9LRB5_9MICC|nr:MBL fold metallo-hydrolase [Psychromicrobium silvestre]NYE94153.1 glyoxylase-like metal-dependent hydrolase (beta-lactamase superfamily II) [Psychromicrobium silvestre]
MEDSLWALPEITIRRISVSSMDNNVYLLTARRSGAQVIIDAADELPAIQGLLAAGQQDTDEGVQARLVAVITTHSHWDHVRALAGLVESTGAMTVAGSLDAADIQVPTSAAVDHGDVGEFDGFSLEAIQLRGHTPGSIALLYRTPDGPDHLFTGDSLFPDGVGNTGNDPERFAQLFGDVSERIFEVLPDETLVHPGHGRGTSLGAERPKLVEWKARGW